MVTEKNKDRLLGVAIIAGFLAISAGAEMIKFFPWFPHLLENPFAAGVVVLSWLTVASFVLWARQPGPPDRVAFLLAVLVVGAIAVLFQGVAPVIGWWAGLAFDAPLLMQALLYGLSLAGFIALLLVVYRGLARRRRWLAVVVYGIFLLLLIPLTIFGDQFALSSGILEFRGGYTIWADVLYGEFLFGLPPILFEVFRRGSGITQRQT